MDDDMQAMEIRDREIELRLESYARVRLSPDPQAIARARARIMREARLSFESAQATKDPAPAVAIGPRRPLIRRLALPALAASVWVGIAAGSMLAAQPGGPLYATRMWVETATLPTAAAPRANTELARLDARLAEAMSAASRGDTGAVQAAVDAYGQIADDAISVTTGDPALEAVVADALDKHRVVLTVVAERLNARGNDVAAAAVEQSIERVIVHNQAVVQRVDNRGAGPNDNEGANGQPAIPGGAAAGGAGQGGGNQGSGNQGGGAGSGGGNGGGGMDGKPDKAPKPTHDPAAGHGNPDHTPRGKGN